MSRLQENISSDARLGEIFFKYRDYSPIPLILILLIVAEPTVLFASFGLSFIFLGEFLRLYSVSFIGPKSRTRTRTLGQKLIEDGPYGISRNPLYLANFFICFGFACYSGKIWFVVVASFVFYVQYHYIIRFEEELLSREFPDTYFSYCERVPRLFPSTLPDFEKLRMPENFFLSLRTEKRTLTTICVVLVFLLIFNS